MYRVGIDLGGTNIATGIVDENYQLVGKAVLKTNTKSVDNIINDMEKTIYGAIDNAGIKLSDIDEIGVGVPGQVDAKSGVIVDSCNLRLYNAPIREMLSKRFGRQVYLENDANAAAIGEHVAGAGKNADVFILITLGTGIGSSVLINGKLYAGCNSAGVELGHTSIDIYGEKCTCGNIGCWEAYASANALIRQTKEAMEQHRTSYMWKLCENKIENVTGKTAFEAMRANDEVATKIVHQYCEYVAIGISNIIHIFHPDVLCIGGGVSNQQERLLDPVKRIVYAKPVLSDLKKKTDIRIAQLKNDAGIIGAALLGEFNR